MTLKLIQGKQIATASWALNAISSSYSQTASYALNAGTTIDTGSLVTTSSFNSFTSSYNTGSFTGSFTGSLLGTSSWAISSSFAISSSRAVSSSFTISSSYALSSSQAQNAVSSSYAATASYSTTLGANITQLSGSDSVALVNSNGTSINIVYINNVSQSQTATTATNINGFSAATVDQINIGETNSGSYAYIVRAQELEESKHTTINIYNNLNFT